MRNAAQRSIRGSKFFIFRILIRIPSTINFRYYTKNRLACKEGNGFLGYARNDTGQRPEAIRTNICVIVTLLVSPGNVTY